MVGGNIYKEKHMPESPGANRIPCISGTEEVISGDVSANALAERLSENTESRF